MLLEVHESSQHGGPSDDEPLGGSGQETCVQCMTDSDTSQGEGGGTLVSCRDNGDRDGTESDLVNELSVHPKEEIKQCHNMLFEEDPSYMG